MIWILIAACARPVPPPVFPMPIPSMEPPIGRVEIEDAPDACPAEASFVPSRPAPYVGEDGHPSCRAQLVPTSQVLQLLQDSDDRDYWQSRATICHDYRHTDRAWAEQVALSCRADLRATQSELRVSQISAPAVLILGVTIGIGLGAAGRSIAR